MPSLQSRCARASSLFSAILLLAGCYSIDVAKNIALDESTGKDGSVAAEHVVVSNYGWYLFNYFPIACGNASPDAVFPWRFFSNHVTARLLHDRMMEYAASKNAEVSDLVFFRDEQVFFTVPGSQFPLPIPYILCFKEIQFSGMMVYGREEKGCVE